MCRTRKSSRLCPRPTNTSAPASHGTVQCTSPAPFLPTRAVIRTAPTPRTSCLSSRPKLFCSVASQRVRLFVDQLVNNLSTVLAPYKYAGYPMLVTTIQVRSQKTSTLCSSFVVSARARTKTSSPPMCLSFVKPVNWPTTPLRPHPSTLRSCDASVVLRY